MEFISHISGNEHVSLKMIQIRFCIVTEQADCFTFTDLKKIIYHLKSAHVDHFAFETI